MMKFAFNFTNHQFLDKSKFKTTHYSIDTQQQHQQTAFEKIVGKEEMLIKSNFSLSLNVFNSIR